MIPSSFPFPLPSSVTATVECPVLAFRARISLRVSVGLMFESLFTKPALKDFTSLTISLSLSIDWEP